MTNAQFSSFANPDQAETPTSPPAFVTFEINNVCYQTLQEPQKSPGLEKKNISFPSIP